MKYVGGTSKIVLSMLKTQVGYFVPMLIDMSPQLYCKKGIASAIDSFKTP